MVAGEPFHDTDIMQSRVAYAETARTGIQSTGWQEFNDIDNDNKKITTQDI